jgi:AcrR family transcriptional regulator
MAKRGNAGKTAAAAAETPAAAPEDRLIDAALALAQRQGWRRTGLGEIAAEAGLPLGDAYALHRSKSGILDGLRRRIDRAALSGVAAQNDDSPRDRLFDLLMRRFDAVQSQKAALRVILRDSLGDPAALLGGLALLRSMAWMLEGAGISTAGWRGRLRTHVLAAVYLSVMRVFLGDDSADLTATMAALDRRLRRAEPLLRLSAGGGEETSTGSAA